MCGFAGILRTADRSREALARDVAAMADTLAHRGPDDRGVWVDGDAGVALGFRRLSILDLSALGHQPMVSAGGRLVMMFNGEVYNHLEIRRELEAHGERFRGHSDTEVVLAAFERWGVERAVERFVGMFAVALWDRGSRTLHLLRDRMGIKPLFVSWQGGTLAFASELKALAALPGFDRSVDPQAVADYLRYLYVPAPRSVFRGTEKLAPGHRLSVSRPEAPPPPSRPWWDLERVAREAAAARRPMDEEEAVERAEALITDAVRLRMRADVPVGAFLSGGIDSSAVVALMRAATPRRVRTFTVGFGERDFDEAPHARAVADLLGTEHTEVRLSGDDALALVPALPDLFDEPLADPSQIPTWLISRVARTEVTVALSGDGGDEVFAGYNRYLAGRRLLPRLGRLPAPARRLMAWGIAAVPTPGWDRAYRALAPALPRARRHRLPGEKLGKVGDLLASGGEAGMYRSLLSAWQDPRALVRGAADRPGTVERVLSLGGMDLLDRMMLADQLSYLPDDLLAKVDRASMAVSLEVRVPLLDHRVVEFGWSLPESLRIRDGKGKWLLRRILRRHLPEAVFERPKMGFSVPVAAWLRGPLRPWAEALLDPERLRRGGLLHPAPVRRAWARLQRGETHLGLALWSVVVFQAWHARWVEGPRPAPAARRPGGADLLPIPDGATCA